LLFHHDPMHSDAFLDRLHSTVTARWGELGGPHSAVELAIEHAELDVGGSNVQEDAPERRLGRPCQWSTRRR
jgi:hypothetical protein